MIDKREEKDFSSFPCRHKGKRKRRPQEPSYWVDRPAEEKGKGGGGKKEERDFNRRSGQGKGKGKGCVNEVTSVTPVKGKRGAPLVDPSSQRGEERRGKYDPSLTPASLTHEKGEKRQ